MIEIYENYGDRKKSTIDPNKDGRTWDIKTIKSKPKSYK